MIINTTSALMKDYNLSRSAAVACHKTISAALKDVDRNDEAVADAATLKAISDYKSSHAYQEKQLRRAKADAIWGTADRTPVAKR